jgi:hypothetical protein
MILWAARLAAAISLFAMIMFRTAHVRPAVTF